MKTVRRLRCSECHRLADEQARGWKALHGREEPEDQTEVIVFCGECAERELGSLGPNAPGAD